MRGLSWSWANGNNAMTWSKLMILQNTVQDAHGLQNYHDINYPWYIAKGCKGVLRVDGILCPKTM